MIMAALIVAPTAALAQNVGAAGPTGESQGNSSAAYNNAHDAAMASRGATAPQAAPVIQLNTPPQPQLCLVPAGAALGSLSTALTLTFPQNDHGCEARLDTFVLESFIPLDPSFRFAAIQRACQIREIYESMASAGMPCATQTVDGLPHLAARRWWALWSRR